MRLKEHQAKQLFTAVGIPVPRSRAVLVGGASSDGSLRDRVAGLEYPLVAKAQTFDGGRGKRGGIRLVDSARSLEELVALWATGTRQLPAVSEVLVEEALDIVSEHYLSISVDRERKTLLVLASPHGGVEVEQADPASFLKLNRASETGLSADDLQSLRRHLGIDGALQEECSALTERLWELAVVGDCMLAEINPMVVTEDGRLLAADARVVVDDAAAVRHPEWPVNDEGSVFERAVSSAGAVGTELDGDVAIITSGAGLGMATLDLVSEAGLRPACLIDLGGVVFKGAEALGQVLLTLRQLRPKVVFINVFLQVGPSDDLAEAVIGARSLLPDVEFVLRLRGRNEDRASRLLAADGVAVHRDLEPAVRLLLETPTKGQEEAS